MKRNKLNPEFWLWLSMLGWFALLAWLAYLAPFAVK